MNLSSKQIQAIKWFFRDQTFLFLCGAVRSGKSYAIDLGWLLWTQGAFSEPRDFIIAGHSVSSVRRNLFPDMMRLCESLGIPWKYSHLGSYVQAGIHKYHVFGSKDADAVDAVRGMTAAGALWDEMVLMDQDFISMCITRCSVPGSKIVASMNPSYPAHYVKTDYIDRADELNGTHISFGLLDNPSLTEEYKIGLKNTLVGVDYERLIEGKWVANAGLVYPNFTSREAGGEAFSRNCIAVDYSTSGTAAFILCRTTREGKTFITDELFHHGGGEGSSKQLTDRELVEKLTVLNDRNSLSSSAVTILPDPSAASFKRECRNQGWNVRSANNDVLEGIRVTNVALKSDHIYVSRKCSTLSRELGTYQWDEKACAKGEDKPLKTDKHHGVDALRYFAMKNYRYLLHDGPIAKPMGW